MTAWTSRLATNLAGATANSHWRGTPLTELT